MQLPGHLALELLSPFSDLAADLLSLQEKQEASSKVDVVKGGWVQQKEHQTPVLALPQPECHLRASVTLQARLLWLVGVLVHSEIQETQEYGESGKQNQGRGRGQPRSCPRSRTTGERRSATGELAQGGFGG